MRGRLTGGRFFVQVGKGLMRMPRPEKVDAVTDIAGRFKEAEAALLTEYRGLRVSEIAEVRDALRATGTEYRVLKNTLARIAVREVGLEELVGMLEGPTAIAFIKGDAAAAAKALDDAAKKYPVLVVKGGVLSGRIIDAEQAKELAGLEPRDIQLAKIAMLMNQPAQMTVNALAALLRDLGSMLAQVVQKKESGELPGGEPAVAEATEPAADAEAQEASSGEASADATKGGDDENEKDEEEES
jgi:large subunit ribosomal protein L10